VIHHQTLSRCLEFKGFNKVVVVNDAVFTEINQGIFGLIEIEDGQRIDRAIGVASLQLN
jgi:hypothetical protein